jgi:hypothetical protein
MRDCVEKELRLELGHFCKPTVLGVLSTLQALTQDGSGVLLANVKFVKPA